MFVTAEDLFEKAGKAWAGEIKMFSLLHPHGVEISYSVLLEGFRLEWNVEWFAQFFLPERNWKRYEKRKALALAREIRAADAAEQRDIFATGPIAKYMRQRVWITAEGTRNPPKPRRRRA